MSENEQGEQPAGGVQQGPLWDPWGHIEKIRAMLPQDGSVMPIDVLREKLGNRTTEGTETPLANAIRDVVGLKFIRGVKGGVVGVRWAPRIGIEKAPAAVQRYHRAAPTQADQSATPTPPAGSSQNRPGYSRD